MTLDHKLAQLEHHIRNGEIFIAERRHAIALAEREGRESQQDRDMLAHLLTAQTILLDARDRVRLEGEGLQAPAPLAS